MSNEKIMISFCETYHNKGGVPLYPHRYVKVLSFHNTACGELAPVYDSINAFFINTQGQKVFGRTFLKAFGFYEGLACVCDESGFYHITEDGKSAYKQRFAWCGNFVEGACVVRDREGRYFHIDSQGQRIYTESFAYVGDYKYGIAVAVLDNGKCVHIFTDGTRVHRGEFLELEPFHKGVAVAKDEKGYFHIDKNGKPLYDERYTKLEPFYNDRALGVDYAGNKIVIESDTLQQAKSQKVCRGDIQASQNRIPHYVNPKLTDWHYKQDIAKKAFDFFEMRIVYAILELGILESIRDTHSLALQDRALPLYSKKLIISWLQTNGYITGENLNNKATQILALKPLICYWHGLVFQTSCYIKESLQEGREYFSHIFGESFFSYLESSPIHRQYFQFIASFYAKDYDITPLCFSNETICDVGCGSGTLLQTIKQQYPHIKAIYADKQDMRIHKEDTFIPVDFFLPLPKSIDADIFIMSRILHDYDDKRAMAILANIADSMRINSTLYLFETLISTHSPRGLSVSFHLLNFLGGRERSLEDFSLLLKNVNLMITNVFQSDTVIAIIEVKKIDTKRKIYEKHL